MKKLISLLAVLALALCAAAFAETAPDAIGLWNLTSVEMSGTSIDPAQFGMESHFTLAEDGTIAWTDTANGDLTGTWTLTGEEIVITINNEPQAFVYDGETISAEQDGVKMVFTKASDDPTGDWFLTTVVAEGATVKAADLGYEMQITLNADGTASGSSSEGDASEGTWTRDGDSVTVEFDGEEMVFAYDITTLSAEMDGGIMTFEREKSTAFVAPAIDETAQLSDFAGTWKCTSADYGTMHMGIEALGIDLSLEIDGETAVYTTSGVSANMTVSMDGSTLVATDGTTSLNVTLHEDGSISTALTDEVTVWFVKAE